MRMVGAIALIAPAAQVTADVAWTTPMPRSAAAESDILAEADRRKGFGFVYSASFVSLGETASMDVESDFDRERVIAVWWSPYSGRAAAHVHAYRWMQSEAHWRHCVVHVVEASASSAELAPRSTLVMRDGSGQVVSKLRVDEAACMENASDVRR